MLQLIANMIAVTALSGAVIVVAVAAAKSFIHYKASVSVAHEAFGGVAFPAQSPVPDGVCSYCGAMLADNRTCKNCGAVRQP